MTGRLIHGMLLAAALFAVTGGAYAQKYPERRVARTGTRLYEKGDYAGAETEYRRALEMDPSLREAAFNLGGALWRQAQEAESENSTGQQGAVQTSIGEDVQARAEAAAGYWTTIAADSLAPAPLASAAGFNAGNVALAAQQFDAAIEAYKMALRIDPADMEAKFNLAYAQKMKQRQQEQEQNDDQNQDQDQDQNDDQNQNDSGGEGENDDQNQNQDQGGDENNDQSNDQKDRNNGDGENDEDNKNNEDNQGGGDNSDGRGDDDRQPPPPGKGRSGEGKINPVDAAHMLEAMQAEEDKTREKMNARQVQAVGRSGKNW